MIDDAVREELLGYLLDAVDFEQQEAIEERLADASEVREELARLSSSLAPLDATWQETAPPARLAARTCEWVADEVEPSRWLSQSRFS
jgi:anti-sigma-K factor RskA